MSSVTIDHSSWDLDWGNFDLGTFRLYIKGHHQIISSLVAEYFGVYRAYTGLILMSTFSSTVCLVESIYKLPRMVLITV